MGAVTDQSFPVWQLTFDGGPVDKARGLGYGFQVRWRKRYSAEVRRIGGEGGVLRVLNSRGHAILHRTVHVPSGEIGVELVAIWVKQVAHFLNDQECPWSYKHDRRTKPLSYCS